MSGNMPTPERATETRGFQIRSLEPRDLERVVQIHCLRFPGQRSTRLGKPFLKRMYEWFHAHHPQFCFVAEMDHEVVGFIVGAVGGYGRRVFRFAFPQVVWGLIRCPTLLWNRSSFFLWHSYLRGLLPGGGSPAGNGSPNAACLSFASLAVTDSAGSSGLYLIREMEKAAKQNGIRRMSHSVRLDNPKVIRLYQLLGWSIDGKCSDSVHFSKPVV